MVESFIALWQSSFPLYTTLNGSTINCIIKELLNLLIWRQTNVNALFFPALKTIGEDGTTQETTKSSVII
jgi:hypothetical protein